MQNQNPPVCLFWSGGKDAALSLYHLIMDHQQVDYLLTTINKPQMRVTMHDVPANLIEKQATALGVKLQTVLLPEMPKAKEYEQKVSKAIAGMQMQGVKKVAFGDIFLEDIQDYRDKMLAPLQIESLYPLWKKNSRELMEEFLSAGFKAIVVSVNARILDKSFVGRELNQAFLNDLPEEADPCGENGEFHTFVYDGPLFQQPVSFDKGEVYLKDYGKKFSTIDVRFWNLNLS